MLGMLAQGIRDSSSSTHRQGPNSGSGDNPVSTRSLPQDGHANRVTKRGAQRGEEGVHRLLRLQPEVIDAIFSGGDQQRRLTRMGLTSEEINEVERLQGQSIASLKVLEANHARPVSDDKGEYVLVEPFPEARKEWRSGIEERLMDLLHDDRAAIVARMIAFSDNDEDVGAHRREIFVTQDSSGRFRIEEKTFDETGSHIDSDYELVDARSHSRWGHLLDFDPKN